MYIKTINFLLNTAVTIFLCLLDQEAEEGRDPASTAPFESRGNDRKNFWIRVRG